MSLVIRKNKSQMDPSTVFWSKIERIYGDIPKLIKMILEFNGFNTYMSLKGIQWDDKQYFFQALEESIIGLADLDDSDSLKTDFQKELRENNQSMQNFKLKLGHKNLIINLCHELQKTSIADFNNAASYSTIQIPELKREQSELIVRHKQKQQDEEHGYSREDNVEEHIEESPERKRTKYSIDSRTDIQEVASPETNEQIQYIYETEEDDQFIDQEFVDDEGEIVEYQEITAEDIDNGSSIYSAEQIVKSEAGNFEQCFEISEFDHSPNRSLNRSLDMKNSKKPKHMYNEEFLQMQMSHGKIGTPGRRRPKIQKSYPDTEEGMLEKWKDLVRQSCAVIVPSELLSRFDLSHIEICKIQNNIWEVNCPMCTKKLRLQLTHEGKYVNFKRSNFERHLRIVHYKQILVFKSEEENSELLEEHTE